MEAKTASELKKAQDSNAPSPALRPIFQDPAVPMIGLPTRFTSRRANCYKKISSGSSIDLADLEGPGCVRHIWILWPTKKPDDGEVVRLEINVDGVGKSQVDMPLKPFFGIMHDLDFYFVECAAYTVLPNPAFAELVSRPGYKDNPGYNLYLPIPFSKSCRITLHNPVNKHAIAQVDWHQYDKDTALTPYRLHADHRIDKPSPRGGYVEMANAEGEGFVAGVVVGHVHRDKTDLVYHTGGMTILLDGETNPHAIRGHNLEDDFGFAWGFNDRQSRWIGCPWHESRDGHDEDGVFYRFFGPDPIYFRDSLSFRTGSRGDDMESVVYTYRIPNTTAPEIQTPCEWQVTERFVLETDWDTFQKSEYVAADDSQKTADTLETDHGWVDLRTLEPHHGPACYAYARTSIESDADKPATLRLAVDDWTVVWLNGQKVAALRHDDGLKVVRIPIKLKKGNNELLVKTSNSDTPPNKRLWVINCVVE